MSSNVLEEFYKLLDQQEGKSTTQEFGHLIEERIEELGLSQRQLSNALSMSRRSIQRLLDGEIDKIDLLKFMKLRYFLAVPFDDLAELFIGSLEPDELRELDVAKKAGFISRTFDLDKLMKAGFIGTTTDFSTIESRIRKYFSYDSVLEYEGDEYGSLFSRTRRIHSNPQLRFWMKVARHQVESLANPHDFDRNMLVKAIPGIRILTRDVKYGLLRASRALYSIGVTVVVQQYLKGTQIRGATMIVDGKPAIILTDFNKRYDTIWFALLHELYHVLKDYDIISEWGVHLTGENNLAVNEMSERNADEFAREFLLSKEKRDYIEQFIDVQGVVESHAQEWNVHPSIIYGSYLWEKDDSNEYKKYRRLIPKPDKALEHLRIYPWRKETAEEAVAPLKSIYTDN